MTSPNLLSILVIGGTGAQGRNVVRELVRDKKYAVTVLTRDVSSTSAVALTELGNVTLIPGSYETEKGLREALKGQHGVYVNFNSFAMTESMEYFWTFRLYEIAVQSGVKRLIYSGGNNRPKGHRYAEEYRSSHQATSGRLSEWLESQPLDLIEWTILNGVVYTEMLSVLLRPVVLPDNTHVFAAPIGDGFIPFAEVATYGKYVRWAFDNPSRSVGKRIPLPTYPTTLKGVAEAFEKATGKKAAAKDVTQDVWFEAAKSYTDPDAKQPSSIPASKSDDTRFTFRQSFGGWWNIWKALRPDAEAIKQAQELADEVYPDRFKSVEDWMRATGYTGEAKAEIKHDADRRKKLQ
ncbi:NmrA-like family protein [Mycena venus]|uniref:NmrA-like family protein n=1 Tax=Mycena venus TaxID=2733690 RepID=A0A8H6YXT8_9AGAR|nr:NmrA-like family protein [Mycena venus]